ncbi:MAG TPA: LysR family transcriptional regulator [Mycobacteriales bacterium]|jgi:DNA-binding transcriptional LysR family regulator|nr:LysR family transcriptional regulator [Mycobacteriales bacterium]
MSWYVDLLVHLKTFVAVAEVLSFSHAADELGIAQPLLSRRIKSLEEHLGGQLFDRGRRQIRITDLGTLLLPHAKDLLARSDHLLEVVRTARGTTGISLAVPPDCDPRLLARAIRAAADRGLVLRVQEMPAAERAEALAGGAVALALVRVSPATAQIRVQLGLASTESLAGPVHLDALRGRRGAAPIEAAILVTVEDDIPLLSPALQKAAARAGLPKNRMRSATSTVSALAETLAGNGFLLCTEHFARRHGVAWAPLADSSICRGYELTGKQSLPGTSPAGLRKWLTPLLAAAVGVKTRTEHEQDVELRLATSG